MKATSQKPCGKLAGRGWINTAQIHKVKFGDNAGFEEFLLHNAGSNAIFQTVAGTLPVSVPESLPAKKIAGVLHSKER
ncbi:MAG: hypothetical protein SPL56_06550 [Lachnospiraceae bacterium]|nr:hypothetical protein [Lachnospiraceae bacterium]